MSENYKLTIMKELSIEEKAKRYDEAIKLAKDSFNYPDYPGFIRADVVFPELKESEGERIRKEIISALKYANHKGVYDKHIAWLENQGEQKTADKVEPKFHEGEWIIFAENHNSVYQVERIDNYRYYLRHYLGGTLSVHFDNELIRLWTIQDAKDGDVLVYDNGCVEIVLLFKKWRNVVGKGAYSYAHITSSWDHISTNNWSDCGLSAHPATKEQRDSLMKAMADSGYTFDFEKKELKKIEDEIEIPYGAKDSELQEDTYYIPKGFHAEIDGDKVVIKKGEKPTAWSEEDKKLTNRIEGWLDTLCEYLKDDNSPECIEDVKDIMEQLESLKDRVLPQPKQKWSEEDEKMYTATIFALAGFMGNEDKLDWLKSLKERYTWKPSDEQMENLSRAVNSGSYRTSLLMELYQDLKKLREE